MGQLFIRYKEDFICEKCGNCNNGSGYTNHCFCCLWSKHVDVFPGDRASKCQGLMEPINIGKKGDNFIVTHKCVLCGCTKVNKLASNDDVDTIIKITTQQAG